MGLPVTVGLPKAIYQLMDLYPQAMGKRPTVQYIPLPYNRPPVLPAGQGKKVSGTFFTSGGKK